MDPTVMLAEGPAGQTISGSIELDDQKMNQLLLQVRLSI